jgi:hypothetical protein
MVWAPIFEDVASSSETAFTEWAQDQCNDDGEGAAINGIMHAETR